jgi:transcriptional regulator with XRE-family HTH domain
MQIGLSEFLRQGRKNKGFTYPQLSKLCGINAKSLATYEIGQTTPSADKLKKICQGLELSYATGYQLLQEKLAFRMKIGTSWTAKRNKDMLEES